ncbi:hypothetical protein C6V08_19690 [Burkholderia gladioli]|nr:hypothetical protein C6V08_19690 [Burkholderia gladioli]PRH35395.1 hypothetical protein C6V07_13870 [Burkholderia gladioli]
MGGYPTNPTIQGCAFLAKHGTDEADACFRAETRKRKPSNPYMRGSTKAELCRPGKARKRLPDSVGIRRCGFQ